MRSQRAKQILQAAASLPPPKGRALLAAAAGATPKEPDTFIQYATRHFETVMVQALIDALAGETTEENS